MSIEDKINEVFDRIRPFLESEGGDISLVKFEDGIAYIKMMGNCANCLYSDYTIDDTIEALLTNEIPEVLGVMEVKEDIN